MGAPNPGRAAAPFRNACGSIPCSYKPNESAGEPPRSGPTCNSPGPQLPRRTSSGRNSANGSGPIGLKNMATNRVETIVTGGNGATDLDRLIEQLNTVMECEQAAARLVWCGPTV